MEKFTSGDWRCVDGTRIGEQVLFVDCAGGVICRLTKEVKKNPLHEEDIANAHLIAAAPDMYAEIKRDVEHLERQMKFKTANDEILPMIIQERDRKLELLTKARGDHNVK